MAEKPDPTLGAPVVIDPLELAVARARAEASLFGDAKPVKVGRYTLIERAGAGGMGVVWSAWDPELGRTVALKLAATGTEGARRRARDEGRALAKLSHPNVVPIYDVLDTVDGVFLVMELVKGKTLRAVAADGASTRELVRAYRQVGEGLAAAHAVGLVHRDFKPDNALLGEDGRVRVLDFGLAREIAGETSGVAGTPKYMAPEQRDGKPVTAAVDQYAMCVALGEAVSPAPRWLASILERGTADDPAARFPDVPALVRALANDPATRWRRRFAIGGVGVAIVATVAAFVIGRNQAAAPSCDGGDLGDAWGTARREAARKHLAELAGPYAEEARARVLDELDRFAQRWTELHGASCHAHAEGAISSELYDRRIACLARKRAALATVGEHASHVSHDRLAELVTATGALAGVEACVDDDALVAAVAPIDLVRRPAMLAIDEQLARADAERDTGEIAAAQRTADDALGRARGLGYRPLVARALVVRGRVALEVKGPGRGAADFEAGTREALAAGDERLAIEAFARAMFAIATAGEPARADAGLPLIEALMEKQAERVGFERALLRMNLGSVSLARGDRTRAHTLFEEARREAMRYRGRGELELTAATVGLLVTSPDAAERAALARELIERRTRILGEHHPLVIEVSVLVAGLADDGAVPLGNACRELARYHPQGEADISQCAIEWMWSALAAGDDAHAVEAAALVGRFDGQGADPNDVRLAAAFASVATDPAATIRTLDPAQPVPTDAPWWVVQSAADADVIRAIALARQGKPIATLTRASARYETLATQMPPAIRARRLAVIARLQGTAVVK